MWQGLYDELKHKNFTVIAVAMDSRPEASRQWIEAAKATYPCLIDRGHHVAELYNMVNVPQAVWIDEEGRIVRPTEAAGAVDSFRSMDRKTFTMSPEATALRVKARDTYFSGLRDWVEKGAASEFAFDRKAALAHLNLPTPEIALANASFRIGEHLYEQGRKAEAEPFLQAAIRLRPESWNFWRQAADLDQVGKASSPEFWARVDALGEAHYYQPVDMKGMPR